VVVSPPLDGLFQPCRTLLHPDYSGRTWADLADYSILIKSRLLQYADKSFIRDWGQPNAE